MNKIRELLDDHIVDYVESDMTTVTVEKSKLKKVLSLLKEDINLKFTQLIDLCAVDYIEYGDSEWQTKEVTSTGYNRGIRPSSHSRIDFSNETNEDEYDLCVTYHLLSITHNQRIRVKCFLDDDSLIIPSVTDLFASADSVNVSRNYKSSKRCPEKMAREIDSVQCPIRWNERKTKQLNLYE